MVRPWPLFPTYFLKARVALPGTRLEDYSGICPGEWFQRKGQHLEKMRRPLDVHVCPPSILHSFHLFLPPILPQIFVKHLLWARQCSRCSDCICKQN